MRSHFYSSINLQTQHQERNGNMRYINFSIAGDNMLSYSCRPFFSKILIAILSVCIFIGSQPLALAESSNLSDILHYRTVFAEDGREIYVTDIDGSRLEFPVISSRPQKVHRANGTSYPSAYDSRSRGVITPVRNQYPYGTCWAFAALACLEASAVSQGFSSLRYTNYSEAHLAWFAHNPVSSDINDLASRDGENIGSEAYNKGGYWIRSSTTLMKGTGAAAERKYPYLSSADGSIKMGNYADSARYDHAAATLYASYKLDCFKNQSATDLRNAVKEKIMSNGAVTVAYHDDEIYASNGYKYYYCNTKVGSNHEVCIIGWDDTISRTYFTGASGTRTPPSSDGAWLIKNSWGIASGNNGYTWISYEDLSLCDFVVYIAGPSDAYDNAYQYDGSTTIDAAGGISAPLSGANVYTATEDTEIVSLAFRAQPTDCVSTLEIYTGLAGATPDTGELAATASISTKYTGFYTVGVSPPVHVSAGERFAVAVSSVRDGLYYVPIEGDYDGITSQSGQSYFSLYGSWLETGNEYNNICVKAYTKASSEHVHKYTADYVWADDYSTCAATAICSGCGHEETETATASVVRTEPTCQSEGSIFFTATFSSTLFTTQTYTEQLDTVEHSYGSPTYTWNSDDSCCTAVSLCTVCGDSLRETGTASVSVLMQPSCLQEGSAMHTVDFINTIFQQQTKTVVIASFGGHRWGAGVQKHAPSCTATGSTEYTCLKCGQTKTEPIEMLPHTFSEWQIEQAPTTTEDGLNVRSCTVCGFTETEVVPKLSEEPGEEITEQIIDFIKLLVTTLKEMFALLQLRSTAGLQADG